MKVRLRGALRPRPGGFGFFPAINGSGVICGAVGGGRWSLVAGLESLCGADGSGLSAG